LLLKGPRTLLGCVLAVFALQCGAGAGPGPEPLGSPAASSSADVADFTLESLDGETRSLSDFAGRDVVLLVFWGSWCQSCVAAMSQLNEVYQRQRAKGFTVLGVSMDGPETVADVNAYVRRNRISFPVLLDQESRAVSLHNPQRVAPYFVLLGRDGRVVRRRDGFQPGDAQEIEKDVVGALGR
jgi:peroxiredoxin